MTTDTIRNLVLVLFAVAVLGLAAYFLTIHGCGKPPSPPPQIIERITIDSTQVKLLGIELKNVKGRLSKALFEVDSALRVSDEWKIRAARFQELYQRMMHDQVVIDYVAEIDTLIQSGPYVDTLSASYAFAQDEWSVRLGIAPRVVYYETRDSIITVPVPYSEIPWWMYGVVAGAGLIGYAIGN